MIRCDDNPFEIAKRLSSKIFIQDDLGKEDFLSKGLKNLDPEHIIL